MSFEVRIEKEWGKCVLSTTHNGYQWTSMLLRECELAQLAEEILEYLGGADEKSPPRQEL